MISCTEFIPAYSEGFKFLEVRGGRRKVDEFWAYLSDQYLVETLKKNVEEFGLEGCFIYWEKALNEEAADFKITLDEEKEEFVIDMLRCPSKGLLIDMKHMEPYKDYCEHCPALYSRILTPMGYKFNMDLSQTDRAKCKLTVRRIREEEKNG